MRRAARAKSAAPMSGSTPAKVASGVAFTSPNDRPMPYASWKSPRHTKSRWFLGKNEKGLVRVSSSGVSPCARPSSVVATSLRPAKTAASCRAT